MPPSRQSVDELIAFAMGLRCNQIAHSNVVLRSIWPFLRQARCRLVVVGGTSGHATLGSAEAFDLEANSWAPLQNLTRPRCAAAAAVICGRLWVAGGFPRFGDHDDPSESSDDDQDVLNCTEIYDPSLGTWAPGPPMQTSRAEACGVNVCGKFLVVGGMGRDGMDDCGMNSCELFDPSAEDGWKRIASMGERRFGAGAAAFGDTVVVVGGTCHPSLWPCIESVEIFDASLGTWRSEQTNGEWVHQRYGAAVAVSKTHMIVVGGDIRRDPFGIFPRPGVPTSTVVTFDHGTGLWGPENEFPPIPTPRTGAMAAIWEGRLFVLGGKGGPSFREALRTVEVLDLATKQWTSLPSMNVARCQAAIAVMEC